MNNSQSRHMDWKWTFAMLLVVAGVTGIGAMVHFEISRQYAEMEANDQRMARVETAVHILADTSGEKTRTRVDEALTISQNAASSSTELLGSLKGYLDRGDKVRATEVAYSAHELITVARENKSPVPPGYFNGAIGLLNNLPAVTDADVESRVLSTRVALAEYHSALQANPDLPAKQVQLKLSADGAVNSQALTGGAVNRAGGQLALAPQTALQAPGAVVDGSAVPPGTDLLEPASSSLAKNGDSVSGLTLASVTQTLDGIEWRNVTFVNSRIRYHGGDLRLENVHFVNCTFEVPSDSRGAQLADYAALESGILMIG
jgi:hypothetical protein